MTKKVVFTLPSELVADAPGGILLGEFNNWSIAEGISLEKKEDGSMIAELALVSGKTYEYRYLLSDGRWVNDNNAKTFSEVFGSPVENCILTVPAEEKKTAEKKAPVKKAAIEKKLVEAKAVVAKKPKAIKIAATPVVEATPAETSKTKSAGKKK